MGKQQYTEYLRTRLHADQIEGKLIWKHCDSMPTWWNSKYAGRIAGSIRKDGYIRITINYVDYFAHRVMHYLQTGEQPPEQIDHINGDKSDNRWSNLRSATQSENECNRGMTRRNKTGYKGVHRFPNGRFLAQIGKNNKVLSLGYFDTAEEAAEAYTNAARQLHGEFLHRSLQEQKLDESEFCDRVLAERELSDGQGTDSSTDLSAAPTRGCDG